MQTEDYNTIWLRELDTSNFHYYKDRANPPIPLLYPLSCLTETINHESKEEIPLVELAKIEETYNGEEIYKRYNQISWVRKVDNCKILFTYDDDFFFYIDGENGQIRNQLALFQYLFSRRINVFGIDAIDPRDCEINPYKNQSMKQITTSKGNWIFLEIKNKTARNFSIEFGRLEFSHLIGYTSIQLPQSLVNNYTFLCTTDTITEDIANGIVDKVGAFYMDYISKIPDLEDALFSFATLITSKQNNLSPSKTYAICKQN
jgi:hypothetical protein